METENRIFQDGEIVFVNSLVHNAEKCQILSSSYNEHYDIPFRQYHLHSLDHHGSFWIKEDMVFATKEEAEEEAMDKSIRLVKKYCEEIKDIQDLIRFPLKHCFNGEEYTEEEARKAYCIRAKELTGTDNLS